MTMPSNYLKKFMHLHSKTNNLVLQNIARLHDLERKSSSQQDLLDQLHPWKAPILLKFNNQPTFLFLLFATCQFLFFLLLINQWWGQFFFLCSTICFAFAYIYYESSQPIQQIIQQLERFTIQHKYQIYENRAPAFFTRNLHSVLLISQLKQKFPLFNQGNLSNEIPFFASTIWENQQGEKHHLLLFHYRFVNEINTQNNKSIKLKINEKAHDLWGVFIFDFDSPLCTLACSTTAKKFPYPYHLSWQTSDIQTNQRIKFYGLDQIEMVKTLNPVFTLKIAHFFAQREGDLLINTEHKMLCFLSSVPLMQIQSKYTLIHDIPALRGHLRTLRLHNLEKLKNDLLQLID